MDLENYIENQEPIELKTICTVTVRLDKNTMIILLQQDYIFIQGNYYKVPERFLLQCLLNKTFGETKLELEKI
jgi:hypothetical protein